MVVSLTVLSILIITIPGFCFGTKNPARYDIPNACCFYYVRQRIKYSLVVDFYETSSLCSNRGIIFLTNKGRQICADPTEEWVREYIFSLKQKKKTKAYQSQLKHFYKTVELAPFEDYMWFLK